MSARCKFAAARLRPFAPLLLVDATAAWLGPHSCHPAGLDWLEAAQLLCGGGTLHILGDPRAGGLLALAQHPLPAGIEPALGGPDRRSQALLALAAALPSAGAPWALFEEGRLTWAAPGLWSTFGLADGIRLGSLFVHPDAPVVASNLERAVAAGAPPRGTVLAPFADGKQVLRPLDLGAALAANRLHELGARWGLTPAEWRELEHLRHGRTSKEAAAIDGISPETNRQRRRQIFAKAGVSSAGALRAALEGLSHAPRRGGRCP